MYDATGIGATYGPPGSGKSVLEADKCVAIGSTLTHWNGRRILNGLALIVGAEAAEGMRRRVIACTKHRQVRLSEVNVAILERAISFEPARVQRLIDTLRTAAETRGLPVRYVVIDTLTANEPGKEDTEHFGRVAAALTMICDQLGCFVTVVHHTGKNVENGLRGSSTLIGALDTAVEVARADADERTATVVKQRDGADGEAFRFRLVPLGIGFREVNGKRDSTVTACAVDYLGPAQPVRRPPKDGHQTRALDALRVCAKDTGTHRWTIREAAKVFESYHRQIPGSKPLHRNIARQVFEALARAGYLLIKDGFVTLERE
jgi:hypothetical protein